MFQILKQLTRPTNKDLRKRIYFTLAVLIIFVVGTMIRVPGTVNLTSDLGFLELINVMGGGALSRFSIFALGVSPYITASILMQLLQMDIVPYFSELKNQGPVGRQKINKITRYVGIAFAFVEGFAFSVMFLGQTAITMDYLYVSIILTAGTAFVLWLGDQITNKGIGNGTSLMIMAGILTSLPSMFYQAYQSLVASAAVDTLLGIGLFSLFVILYILIIIGIIYVQEADRKVPVQYSNKSSAYTSNQSFMPIKLNSAGVVPVIFASTIMSVPGTIAQFVNNEGFKSIAEKYLTMSTPIGLLIYALLIFFFGYFYTFIQLRPDELSKNLADNGGYVPGIRPGKETENYISKVLSRLTVVGSLFLIFLAGFPILFQMLINLIPNVYLPQTVTLGGTGLLIVVGVALETYKQLEGSLVSRNYHKGYRGR